MKLKYEFSVQEVADMFVAVAKNPSTQTVEQVFRLNETGALILKALQEGKEIPDIVHSFLAQYDIQPAEAEAEVTSFINMLQENGWAE